MALVEVPIPQEMADELEESLYQGPMLDEHGMRMLNEELVDRLNKLSIAIFADEHPPPHFHVKFAGENASFSIADGVRLPGIRGLEKYDHNIRKWWTEHYCKLIEIWNRTRPADCRVGPVPVPSECQP
jgi:hypothetical protein